MIDLTDDNLVEAIVMIELLGLFAVVLLINLIVGWRTLK